MGLTIGISISPVSGGVLEEYVAPVIPDAVNPDDTQMKNPDTTDAINPGGS